MTQMTIVLLPSMEVKVINCKDAIPEKDAEVLTCKVCGKEVRRDGDKLVRSCEHSDSPVLSEMRAIARGMGTIIT
jgi:hypothetical protein